MSTEKPRFANGSEPPRVLRYAMKVGIPLSNVQCEEFDNLVKEHDGWPRGVPAARAAFGERYVISGRRWVRKDVD